MNLIPKNKNPNRIFRIHKIVYLKKDYQHFIIGLRFFSKSCVKVGVLFCPHWEINMNLRYGDFRNSRSEIRRKSCYEKKKQFENFQAPKL